MLRHDLLRAGKMQGVRQAFLSHGSAVKNAVLQRVRVVNPMLQPVFFSRSHSVTSARMEEHGFESTTIADILKSKGKGADGSWLWCTMDDTVYDAVKSVRTLRLFQLYNISCYDVLMGLVTGVMCRPLTNLIILFADDSA